jgi:hypothetical protein
MMVQVLLYMLYRNLNFHNYALSKVYDCLPFKDEKQDLIK